MKYIEYGFGYIILSKIPIFNLLKGDYSFEKLPFDVPGLC